jgi:IclR family acetate operon transcriptional repressor
MRVEKAENLVEHEKEVGGPRSLMRLLGLFDALARLPEGMSLADLSVTLETPKSSLLNLLRPLVAEGYLMHDSSRYRLGPAIFRMSANIMTAWNVSKVLHPFLVELSEAVAETVYMGVLDVDEPAVTYVDVVESSQPVRYTMSVGQRRPLYCTAAGRVLLAHASEKFIDQYLRTIKLEKRTPTTVSTKKALREELQRIVVNGISITRGEFMPDSAGLAVPVRGPNGTVIAAVAIGAPIERFDRKLDQLKVAMVSVGRRISGIPL